MKVNTIKVQRSHTMKDFEAVARHPGVPTVVVSLLQTLIHRINELEEQAGYVPEDAAETQSKVDTQGR